ncbi:MAG: pyridoxine 5'-phosphate synthase [Hyphomicrobiales bacterium]|nr:pyridoxine 5'-phosphate synthase [Hyphomicrobiales bacterium]
MSPLRLGVNIDHVATVRNARGGAHPDPVRAALAAAEAGADGITAHLREDRRHIRDADIARLKSEVRLPLNLEMAATPEMLAIALAHRPNACCLVPERREEVTTEGGLNVAGQIAELTAFVAALRKAGIRVSLFIDADDAQVAASAGIGADIVELHTGVYCDAPESARVSELERLRRAARQAAALGLEVHAGHGLGYATVGPVAAIPQIVELNIGHFIVGEALFLGLDGAVKRMRVEMDAARRASA